MGRKFRDGGIVMAKILVIDDDIDLLELMKNSLENKQNKVITRNCLEAVTFDDLQTSDIILLDVMMPKQDGFAFLRKNRHIIDAPVLFLTAKVFESDKLEGFASGGDDYITKPFSVNELRARVDAHIRRENREKHVRISDGAVFCDLIQKKFMVNDEDVPLTKSEYELALYLLKRKGQVFSKENIYLSVLGYDEMVDINSTITERVKFIRKKFSLHGVNPIQTVWGLGYKWEIKH